MLDLSHLPAIDLGSVYCLNAVRAYRDPVAVPVDDFDHPILLEISEEPLLTAETEMMTIVLYTEVGIVAVTTEAACVDLLSDTFLPEWAEEDPEKLIAEWRAIFAFEQILNASPFAELPSHVIHVMRPEEAPHGPDAIHAKLSVGDQVFGAAIALAQGQIEALAKYVAPKMGPQTDMSDLNVRVSPLALGPVIAIDEVRNLTAGDVLILPDCAAGAFPLTLRIDADTSWAGMCDENGNFTIEQKGN